MIALLSRFFLREGMSEESRRGAYGVLCGVAGIILNILLFAGKFFAGLLSNSVAITADAFNNLSDAGSSVVTLAGFRLAGQKPDAEHPYGHGRMEYIAGLVVSGVILLMAFELLKESVGKIITPEETICSPLVVAILIVSILGKCYMASYNFRIGRQIDSAALKATGTDSLSDCVSTGVVLMVQFKPSSAVYIGVVGFFPALILFLFTHSISFSCICPLSGSIIEQRSHVAFVAYTGLSYPETNSLGILPLWSICA